MAELHMAEECSSRKIRKRKNNDGTQENLFLKVSRDNNDALRQLFREYNARYFGGMLRNVEVNWSTDMITKEGEFYYVDNGCNDGIQCVINLSQSRLKIESTVAEALILQMTQACAYLTACKAKRAALRLANNLKGIRWTEERLAHEDKKYRAEVYRNVLNYELERPPDLPSIRAKLDEVKRKGLSVPPSINLFNGSEETCRPGIQNPNPIQSKSEKIQNSKNGHRNHGSGQSSQDHSRKKICPIRLL